MSDSYNESDQSLLEEIEALKAILFSEIDMIYTENGRPTQLQTTLYPSTAHDANQQYVCLTLIMKFPLQYPDEIPIIELKNPRGLGEDFLAKVFQDCQVKCQQFSGCPVIYEIIELIRESLTNSNKPIGHCTICLFEFHSEDVFTYTPCYHHFHSHCLSRFCENLKKQWKEDEDQEAAHNPNAAIMKDKKPNNFTCPVCREVISVDLEALKLAPPPHGVQQFKEEFQADEKFKTWKLNMEKEFSKQKAKGGIIDREAEDNRFLVVTDVPSSSSSTELSSSPVNADQPHYSEQLHSNQTLEVTDTQLDPNQHGSNVRSKHSRQHFRHHDRLEHHHKRWHNPHRVQNKSEQTSYERFKSDQEDYSRNFKEKRSAHQGHDGSDLLQKQPGKQHLQTETKPQETEQRPLPLQPQSQLNHRHQRSRQRNNRQYDDADDIKERRQDRPPQACEPNHQNHRADMRSKSTVPNHQFDKQECEFQKREPVNERVKINKIGQNALRPPPPGFEPR